MTANQSISRGDLGFTRPGLQGVLNHRFDAHGSLGEARNVCHAVKRHATIPPKRHSGLAHAKVLRKCLCAAFVLGLVEPGV